MSKTAIAALQEYFQKRNQELPVYNLIDQKSGTHANTFTIRVSCGSFVIDATASSKKAAKHEAAEYMIKLLRENNHSINCTPVNSGLSVDVNTKSPGDFNNSIGELQEICMKNNIKLPIYEESSTCLNSQFTVSCTVGTLKTSGTGSTKKQAKHNCAENMKQELLKFNLLYTSNKKQDMDDVELLRLEIPKLNLADDLPAKALNEKAKQLFPQLQQGYRSSEKNLSNLPITSWHSAFKDSIDDHKIETILSYCETRSFETLGMASMRSAVDHICKTLNTSFEKSYMKTKCKETYAVSYTLKTTPAWEAIGVGIDRDSAEINAAKEAIRIIKSFLI